MSSRILALVTASMLLGIALLEVGLGQETVPRDTTTKTIADSTSKVDSLKVRFIPAIGSMRQEIDSSGEFHSTQLLWTDARDFGNLSWRLPGFFLRNLGEPAKPGQLNAWGEDGRGIAILMDGRPMNDPITGTYNISDMPMEFVEQLEEFDGSSSIGQSWNAPGATLNFVTRQYNTLRPITKVRFVQSPYNNLLTDGLFTQNILRGLNFMFGFQRQVSDGRFNGSRTSDAAPIPAGAVDNNWNVRTRLRYNVSDRLNFALTDFYTKDAGGLNGGVDAARSSNIFDDVSAFVNDPNGRETVARRDVSLLGIGKLTGDSTAITQLNAYYTHLERSYKNPGSEFGLLNISDFHYAEVRGLRLQQSIQSPFHRTTVGIETEHSQYASNGFLDTTQARQSVNNAKRSVYSAFLTTSLHPLDLVNLGVSGRFDRFNSESNPSYGARVSVTPIPFIRLSAEYGRSVRFPTFQETSWADSTIQRPLPIRREVHTFSRAGIEFRLGDFGTLSAAGFNRDVSDAIVFQPSVTANGSRAVRILNVPGINTQGIVGSLNLMHGPFTFEGTLLFTHLKEQDTTKLLVPRLALSGEVAFRNKFFKDHLDAKLGLRAHLMSQQQGMTFNPRFSMYTENTGTDLGQWSRVDIFLVLKIGDAYINLSYENLLNASYMITPVYPMPARSFRLGVNWVFID